MKFIEVVNFYGIFQLGKITEPKINQLKFKWFFGVALIRAFNRGVGSGLDARFASPIGLR